MSLSQLTEARDRVRSFGGYNNGKRLIAAHSGTPGEHPPTRPIGAGQALLASSRIYQPEPLGCCRSTSSAPHGHHGQRQVGAPRARRGFCRGGGRQTSRGAGIDDVRSLSHIWVGLAALNLEVEKNQISKEEAASVRRSVLLTTVTSSTILEPARQHAAQ